MLTNNQNQLVLLSTAILLAVAAHCSPATGQTSAPSCQEDSNASKRIVDDSRMSQMSCLQDKESPFGNKSQILIRPLLRFTGSLFDKVRSNDSNVVLSPLSIHAALSLVALGAKHGSATEKELRKGLAYDDELQMDLYHEAYKNVIVKLKEISKLGLEALKKSGEESNYHSKPPVIDFFNTLITKRAYSFKEQYSKSAKSFYNSTVQQIDLRKPETVSQVVGEINKWAKEAGFEQDILDANEFKGNVAAMLLSAVRVQAFWFKDLYEGDELKSFYNFGLKEKAVKVEHLEADEFDGSLVEFKPDADISFKKHFSEVMKDSSEEVKGLAELNFRAVDMPLQGGLSLTIFEPTTKGKGDNLRRLARKLFSDDVSNLDKVLRALDRPSSDVRFSSLSLPKFAFDCNIDLIASLKSIGIVQIFERATSQLDGIIQGDPVCVSSAKHQAMIEINKYGLKAAGVTQIFMTPLSLIDHLERIYINIENPFIFMVRFKGVPLFIGQLVELSGKDRPLNSNH